MHDLDEAGVWPPRATSYEGNIGPPRPVDDDESGGGDIGPPRPTGDEASEPAAKKKRKSLPFEQLYLENLPSCEIFRFVILRHIHRTTSTILLSSVL